MKRAETYTLFKIGHALVSNKQKEPDRCWLTSYSNPEYGLVSIKQEGTVRCWLTRYSKSRACLVSNKQEGTARCWLTICSKPRACSCQHTGRASQMMTYSLFKTQSMLLSKTSRKGQSDADLLPVQNPEQALISSEEKGSARCWLTACSKSRACSSQKQAERATQMLTYTLVKIKSMFLSATSRKGHPDSDLHPGQNPENAPVSNMQEGTARCWLTNCSNPRACSCQQQADMDSQMLTYILFKTQSIVLSGTSRKGQPDAGLHPVQNPEHALFSNKQKGTARCWLTACLKPKACSCQQQAGRDSKMLTYILFKTQSMLLSGTSRRGQQDADLQTVQNPDHALVSNKQEGKARCWLTNCLKPRACSCQE